jgi:hypothetical protein
MDFEEWWEQVEAYGLGLPEGYVLVPVEPTEKMIDAGLMFHSQFSSSVPHAYKAMIQAAQEEE